MALSVLDANGVAQSLPEWVDNVYRFSGSLTAAQAAGTAKDILLLTAKSTGVTRLLAAKFTLGGGGTASGAGGWAVQMGRVSVAPTGQTNVAITGRPHLTTATAVGSTCNITPNTTQTEGTSFLELGREVMAVSLLSTGGDKFQADRAAFNTGIESMQQGIVIPASGFVTFRAPVAAPTASVIHFDIMISESAA